MQKIVFLDRDGVINEFPGYRLYVTKAEDFKFLPGSIEAIRLFKKHHFKVYVASNQAGVAKGIYSFEDLSCITDQMLEAIRAKGSDVDGINYCLHTDEDNCDCRKPKPGLLTKVIEELGANPGDCFFIGDSLRDVKAAHAAGCRSVLVFSGQTKEEDLAGVQVQPDYTFQNLLEAAQFITGSFST